MSDPDELEIDLSAPILVTAGEWDRLASENLRLIALFEGEWTRACRAKRDAALRLRQSLDALIEEERAPGGIRESVTEAVLGAMEDLQRALWAWLALEPLAGAVFGGTSGMRQGRDG